MPSKNKGIIIQVIEEIQAIGLSLSRRMPTTPPKKELVQKKKHARPKKPKSQTTTKVEIEDETVVLPPPHSCSCTKTAQWHPVPSSRHRWNAYEPSRQADSCQPFPDQWSDWADPSGTLVRFFVGHQWPPWWWGSNWVSFCRAEPVERLWRLETGAQCLAREGYASTRWRRCWGWGDCMHVGRRGGLRLAFQTTTSIYIYIYTIIRPTSTKQPDFQSNTHLGKVLNLGRGSTGYTTRRGR